MQIPRMAAPVGSVYSDTAIQRDYTAGPVGYITQLNSRLGQYSRQIYAGLNG